MIFRRRTFRRIDSPTYARAFFSYRGAHVSTSQLISHPEDRIGKTSIAIDPDRVVAIVESHLPDNTGANSPETPDSVAIAGHLIEFLSSEVDAGRMPKSLLPLQSGIGNVANSIIGGLAAGPFDKVMVWTEVLQGD